MLTREDNDLLTRVGPGTPMGALLREYCMPVVQSREVEPGGKVKRVQLLGERMVVYRATQGQPGIIGEFCPHRGASLYFGRVEDAGMRCVYHGWQYGLDGQCLEMPCEPAESSFASKVRHVAYPCVDQGGVIWAYMGPTCPPPSGRSCRRVTPSSRSASRSATGSRLSRAGSIPATSPSSTPPCITRTARSRASSTARASEWARRCRRPIAPRASRSWIPTTGS